MLIFCDGRKGGATQSIFCAPGKGGEKKGEGARGLAMHNPGEHRGPNLGYGVNIDGMKVEPQALLPLGVPGNDCYR